MYGRFAYSSTWFVLSIHANSSCEVTLFQMNGRVAYSSTWFVLSNSFFGHVHNLINKKRRMIDVIFSCLFSIITQGTSSFVHILISKQQLPNKLQLTWPLHDKYCSPNRQIHVEEKQLEIFQGHTLSSTLNKNLKFTIVHMNPIVLKGTIYCK
jgi:hypothetical protein